MSRSPIWLQVAASVARLLVIVAFAMAAVSLSNRIAAIEKQNRLLRWRLYCIEFDIGLPMTNPPATFEPARATDEAGEGKHGDR